MPSRFFSRERFFIGVSRSGLDSSVVFATDDLTEDECRALAESVQQYFDEQAKDGGEEMFFELAPSAEENLPNFINLKSEWDSLRNKIEDYRGEDGCRGELYTFYSIASEHADIIRELACDELPIVYYQYDEGHGYKTLARIDCLTWAEIDVLSEVLAAELNEWGMRTRNLCDQDIPDEAAEYVRAKLDWERNEESLSDSGDETLKAAHSCCWACVNQIFGLRKARYLIGESDYDEESNQNHESEPEDAKNDAARHPSADLMLGYRDPDNYWRNVWLYEQRKGGATNATILEALRKKASEKPDFFPLESENALRTAIDTIAAYHGWPALKGKAGRPKANHSIAKPHSAFPKSELANRVNGEVKPP